MIDRAKFFDAIRPLFGSLSTTQVSGTEALLTGWEASGASDLRWLAYILATARHETAGTMQPIEEYGKGRGHPYGVPTGPWHQIYDGRGFDQLTWERNYVFATRRLRELGLIGPDIDLDKTPELAMRPDIAAAIAVIGAIEGWFTGKKLADYFNSTTTDWVNARRIINGTDQAVKIGVYGRDFYGALATSVDSTAAINDLARQLQIPTEPQPIPTQSIPIPPPDPRPAPTPTPQPASSGFFSAIAALFGALFRRN